MKLLYCCYFLLLFLLTSSPVSGQFHNGVSSLYHESFAKLLRMNRQDEDATIDNTALFSQITSLEHLFIDENANNNNGTSGLENCTREVYFIAQNFNKSTASWARHYMDSQGITRPAGFLSGNFRWLGDFDQCRSIETVYFSSSNNYHYGDAQETVAVSPKYCRIELGKLNSSLAIYDPIDLSPTAFSISICAPKTCQIEHIVQMADKFLKPRGFQVQQKPSKCYDDNVPYNAVSIFTIILFSLVGFALLAALVVEIWMKLDAWLQTWRSGDCHDGKSGYSDDEQNTWLASLIKLALLWSPYANFRKLYHLPLLTPATNKQEQGNQLNLDIANGMRTFAIFFVVLGHMTMIMMFILENSLEALQLAKRVSFMFVFRAVFAVDTFLFLSGFFAYWSLAKQVSTRKSIKALLKQLPSIYFRRYLRLTPPYLAMLLVDLGLWIHLSTGPLYFHGSDKFCAANWWTNLLYLNNIINYKDKCAPWTWYLAVDMQLFLFVPFIAYLFSRKPVIYGWLAAFAGLAVQIVVPATLTVQLNLPTFMQVIQTNATRATPRNSDEFWGLMYDQAYAHVGPYVIGLLCAHLALKDADFLKKRFFNNFWLSALMWFSTFAVILTLTYSQYDSFVGLYVTSTVVDAIYNAFARIAWGLAIGWLMLACIFNYAGPITGILSWPFWAVPARLSYSIYLIHPYVVLFYVQTSRRNFHLTDMTLSFHFCATIVICLLVSTPFSLAFEAPLIGLQNLLKKKKPTITIIKEESGKEQNPETIKTKTEEPATEKTSLL